MQTTEMFWWIEHHLFTIGLLIVIFFSGAGVFRLRRKWQHRRWVKSLRNR